MRANSTDDPIVAVTTYMEQSLAPGFQTWAQRALEALRSGGDPPEFGKPAQDADPADGFPFVPLTPRQALERYPDAWANQGWEDNPDDVARAVWLLKDLGAGKARDAVAVLLAEGRIRGDELAARAGYGPRGLPPALKHIATRCRQVARRPMWEFAKDAEGYGHYWMEDATRAVFRKAFDDGAR